MKLTPDDWKPSRVMSGCVGKVQHESHDAALKHARSLGGPVDVYHCGACGKWHVGRNTRRSMKAINYGRRRRGRKKMKPRAIPGRTR